MGFQHSFAVIVGIDDYQSGISPLQTPVCDAQALAEILQTQHGYETHVFLNDRAQKAYWIELLEEKLPQWVKKGDRLLFYFAGHGIALNGENGPEGYLIPQDARLGDVSTYLSMSRVHDALHQLPCRHLLCVLDCCFAGTFRWSGTRKAIVVELDILHKERFDRFIQDPAWQIITSAAHDQTALDAFSLQAGRGQSGKHSPFAAALIEALRGRADVYPPAEGNKPAGDGVTTASELYMYVRDRVEIATEAQDLLQTPGIHPMKKHDKGEFIFLTPGHELNLPSAPPLDASYNPYRGLQPFELEHSELFFGRSELTDKLEAFITRHPLTVVQGASGAGKSSLIKAGLIPKLKQATDNHWAILPTIRPGETPFQALNKALTVTKLPTVEPQNPDKTITQSVRAWAERNPDQQLIIFIDQIEEIITLCTDEIKRHAFFQQILAAIDAYRTQLRVVLSLRSDFEPQVREAGLKFAPAVLGQLDHSTLEARWRQGRFLVPMMTRTELRETIEKPAEARVMHFQPHNLVDQLIDEVVDMPGALPLLSFALSELYLKYLARQQSAKHSGTMIDRALTQSDYEELGGVIQSLTQRANQEYDSLVSQNPAYGQVIRQLMLRMVAFGGGEVARRRVPLSELDYPPEKNSLVQNVIKRFSTARLIISGQDVEGNSYVEPAHDALVRGWDKLQSWLAREKDLTLQRRLTPSALEWKRQQQAKFLWHANPYLDVLNKRVLKNLDNNWLNQLETEFVQRSLQKRRNNQRRLRASVASVIFALSGFSIFAGYQWRQAEIGQVEALTGSSKANFISNRNSFSALVDSLTASKRALNIPFGAADRKPPANLLSTLTQSLNWVRETNHFLGHSAPVLAVSFSPDGQLIATGSHDKTVKLWKPDGSLVETLKGHKSEVISVSFSPDSQMIASGDTEGRLKIWDGEGNLIQDITADEDYWIMGISFGPNGEIATSSSAKTVRIWRVEDGQQLNAFEGHQDWVRYVRISPNGHRVATLSDDGQLKLWSQDNENPVKTFEQYADETFKSLDLSGDGQFLFTVSEKGNVRRWNWEGELIETSQLGSLISSESIWPASVSQDGKIIATASQSGNLSFWASDGSLLDTWIGHDGFIYNVAFSPDGKTLVSTDADGNVKLWQVYRDRLTTLNGYPNNLFSAEFNPNGEVIAGATKDGKVKIWNRSGELILVEDVHQDDTAVNALSFSPLGNVIATGGNDQKIKLIGVEGNRLKEIREIDGHEDHVVSVSFHSEGDMIASASADGTAKLWDLSGKELTTLVKGVERVLSVAFSPDGETIATGGDDPDVKLLNLQGQKLATLTGHTGEIWGISFSPDGTTIATASGDETVKLWRQNGTLITTLEDHEAAVLDVSFSPDGEMLASASSDRTIKLWQRDGTLINTLTGHQGSVHTVDFSPNGRWLVSTSTDQNALLWDASDINFQGLMEKGCNHLHDYLKHQTNDLKDLCF